MFLRLEEIGKHFGPRVLFENVQLSIRAGDRIGLVGPNGAGKSTLLAIAAGEEKPDFGQVFVAQGARIEQLRQEIDPTRSHSVHEEVSTVYAHLDALEAELRELEHAMAAIKSGEIPTEIATRYDQAQQEFTHAGGYDRHARVDQILAGLGFDNEARQRPLKTFSGGWLMRVELAKLLLREPDVLLLDEPTNHLDLPSIRWFEGVLDEFKGAALIVSHDRTFLQRHCNRIAELANQQITVYEGNYDRYLEQRATRQEQLEAQKRTQDRKIAETERFIERFRAKASKAKQAQSRVKALEKIERVELIVEEKRKMRIRIPASARSGDRVIELKNIHKSYGEKAVYSGVDFLVRRGERVALAGPNGAGKSTLLRIIAGNIDFDSGTREVGHNVEVGFFAQHQLDSLDMNKTVYEELEASAQFGDIPRLRAHLGAFLFSGDDVHKKISVLSGGEKARVALAKMLLRPVNCLVLDEPTNHLDLAAREVLEAALQEYTGTLVFISHDRSFINALATRVVQVKAGTLENFLGNYDFYLERIEAAEAEAQRQTAANERATRAQAAQTREHANTAERKADRQAEQEKKRAQERATRRIAKIESELDALDAKLRELDQRLEKPEVYSSPDACREIETERSALQTQTAALTAEWEALAAQGNA